MKKSGIVLSIAVLGLSALSGCTLANSSQSEGQTLSPLEKEIGSSALLLRGTSSSTSARLLYAQKEATTASPITIDASNVGATLASFDALASDQYSLKSETLTSDKSEYSSEEKMSFSLPDQSTEEVYLYYGDPEAVAVEASGEAGVSYSGTSGDGMAIAKGYVHGYGYRGGAFAGMLDGKWTFADDEDKEDVTTTSNWKAGLALIGDSSYHFFLEELDITTSSTHYTLTSFALVGGYSRFLSVEQARIENDGAVANVYAYTSFNRGSYSRFLLRESAEAMRLVYKTPLTKVAINRFVDEGTTLYSIHYKQAGSMALVGLYEKVVTTNADGSETVTYQVYDKTATIPDED